MMDMFTSRKPKRLETYNYSRQGYYYITICTYNRVETFGKIEDNKMVLNEYGDIAKKSWLDLPNHHKNMKLDEFIIMPNHVHGIISLTVGSGPARTFTKYKNTNNLSIIIGSYKSSVSRQINKLDHNKFRWQRSFHENIIRTSDLSLYNIRKYIMNNPLNWDTDENNINRHCRVRACPDLYQAGQALQ
jgi:putative transposase